MKIAICDDVAQDRIALTQLLHHLAEKRGASFAIDAFSDGASLLDATAQTDYDLIFFDIYMDGISGIETAQLLPPSFKGSIIFTTTSPDFALDAFALDAVHYLLKPITMPNLEEAYSRVLLRRTPITAQLTITVDRRQLVIPQDDIDLVEANNKSSLIHAGTQCYKTYEPINALRQRLDEDRFILPHRSYIVNLDFIDSYQKTRLVLKNGLALTIGRQLREDVAARYTKYLADIVRGVHG